MLSVNKTIWGWLQEEQEDFSPTHHPGKGSRDCGLYYINISYIHKHLRVHINNKLDWHRCPIQERTEQTILLHKDLIISCAAGYWSCLVCSFVLCGCVLERWHHLLVPILLSVPYCFYLSCLWHCAVVTSEFLPWKSFRFYFIFCLFSRFFILLLMTLYLVRKRNPKRTKTKRRERNRNQKPQSESDFIFLCTAGVIFLLHQLFVLCLSHMAATRNETERVSLYDSCRHL